MICIATNSNKNESRIFYV